MSCGFSNNLTAQTCASASSLHSGNALHGTLALLYSLFFWVATSTALLRVESRGRYTSRPKFLSRHHLRAVLISELPRKTNRPDKIPAAPEAQLTLVRLVPNFRSRGKALTFADIYRNRRLQRRFQRLWPSFDSQARRSQEKRCPPCGYR